MNTGCTNCSPDKPQDIELQTIIQKATAYGKQEQISVAIIKEGEKYAFREAFAAYQAGCAVIRVLCFNNKVAAQ